MNQTLIQAARRRVETKVIAARNGAEAVIKELLKNNGFKSSVTKQPDGSNIVHIPTSGPKNLLATQSLMKILMRNLSSFTLKEASLQIDATGISIHLPKPTSPKDQVKKWRYLVKKMKSIGQAPDLDGFIPLHKKARVLIEKVSSLEIGEDDGAIEKALSSLDEILDAVRSLPPQRVVETKVTKDLLKTILAADSYTEDSDTSLNSIDLGDPLDWLMVASLVNVDLKKTETFRRRLDTGSRDELPNSLYTLLGHDSDDR